MYVHLEFEIIQLEVNVQAATLQGAVQEHHRNSDRNGNPNIFPLYSLLCVSQIACFEVCLQTRAGVGLFIHMMQI
jgi:hypothetical protein